MTAVVSFGQAAAGCGVQSEHEAHACGLGSGGLLQTGSSDRYHVPWGWVGPRRRRGIIQSQLHSPCNDCFVAVGGLRAVVILQDATCADRPLRISAAGRRRLTDRPTPPAFAARMISLSALSLNDRRMTLPDQGLFV